MPKVSAARLIQFAGSSANAEDSNQLQTLQFDNAQHMLPETSPFQAMMDSDFEQLCVELEVKTEDVADTYVHISKAREGQMKCCTKGVKPGASCFWQSSIDTMPAQKEQHVNVHIQV
ncbi:hypothetical protein FRC11_002914, partial [Ceratobasidium sp. 423]